MPLSLHTATRRQGKIRGDMKPGAQQRAHSFAFHHELNGVEPSRQGAGFDSL
jgi:hypothetical protein